MAHRKARTQTQLSDYRDLPAKTVAELAKRAKRIKAALRRSLTEVGYELTEAKRDLNHGQFTSWIIRETDLTPRAAQMIMAAYKLCRKNENFSLLPRSALFALSGADVPASVITAIEKRIAKGDVPSYTDVRTILHIERPSPVDLASKMTEPLDTAEIVDLRVHRTLAAESFLRKVGFTCFGLYVQDYGGPVGFRIVGQHPEWLEWLIIQNTNAYEIGFTPTRDELRSNYWKTRSADSEKAIGAFPEPATVKVVYTTGTPIRS
jgi:hypothetical protein